MHAPPPLCPMERALAQPPPHLRGPQRRGLALWVLGAVLAHSACQAAVLVALLPWAPYHALRQRLREWLLDGADKAVPCAAQVEVDRCFAPLLRWVLGWWQGRGHRQVDAGEDKEAPSLIGATASCGSLDARDLSPDREGLRADGSVLAGGEVIAVEMKEVVDLVVGGEEPLRLAG